MSHADPGTRPHRRGIFAALALALVTAAGGAAYADLRSRQTAVLDQVATLTAKVDDEVKAVQLLRFEQKSKTGLGMEALLTQLRHWGPQYDVSSTPASQLPTILEQCQAVIGAMEHLGASTAMPALEQAFFDPESDGGSTYREWLLRAMAEVDPKRAAEFFARVTRGLEFAASPQLRVFAADQLLRVDRERAAEVLRRILETESHNGVDPSRLSEAERRKYPNARKFVPSQPRFYDFINRYVRSEDPRAPEILLQTLGRGSEHDVVTIQECVKALGKLKVADAAQPIEDLFEAPPPGATPMFRDHCLDALVSILGADAAPYLRKALRTEQQEMVKNKLVALLKKVGG